MITTWLTLAALHGRWQICPFTSSYRGHSVCATWSPAQEFKIDADTGRFTLLSVRHFAGGPRYCHFAESGEISEARPRGSRFRVLFRRVEDVVLETGGKYEACSRAHATEAPSKTEWVFETYGDQILVKFPDGMKPHLLRKP